jgi:uncharacterized cupin superfamily protein
MQECAPADVLRGGRDFPEHWFTSENRPEGARIATVPGAELEDFGSGLTPVTQGWFVVNVRDAEWWSSKSRGGARCAFENEYGDRPVEFAQLGINVTVLEPGQTGLYHAESNQDAFLVLSGECALLVEGEERRLRPGLLPRSPVDGARLRGRGRGAVCVLLVGSRSGAGGNYPVSQLAARYGASVAEETSDWRQAYATVERFRRERPPSWARLPGRRFLQESFATLGPRQALPPPG